MIRTAKCENCGKESTLNVKSGFSISQEPCGNCNSQGTLRFIEREKFSGEWLNHPNRASHNGT